MKKLISKQEMLTRKWRDFSHYPKQGENIVLHIEAYIIRGYEKKHDFLNINNFDAKTFDVKRYIPRILKSYWTYSWLPTDELLEEK